AALVVPRVKQLDMAEYARLVESYGSQAVQLLHKAVHEGYRDRAHMDRDTDLDPLRGRKDYQQLVADIDRRFPAPPLTPTKEFNALVQEYQNVQMTYAAARRSAETVAEKKRAEARKPNFSDYAERALKLARKHHTSPAAVEALVWVLETTAPTDG